MGDLFAGIVVLAGFGIFVTGVLALFKPMPQLKLNDRNRAAMALAGGLILIVVAATLAAPEPPTAAQPAEPPSEVAEVEAPKKPGQEELEGVWAVAKTAAVGCAIADSRLLGEMEELGGKVTPVDLYAQAVSAYRDCRRSDESVALLLDDPTPAAAALKVELADCRRGFAAHQQSISELGDAIDLGPPPSAVYKFRSQSPGFVAVQQCLQAIREQATAKGFELDTLPPVLVQRQAI